MEHHKLDTLTPLLKVKLERKPEVKYLLHLRSITGKDVILTCGLVKEIEERRLPVWLSQLLISQVF
ncbi:hypothetical protein J6590_045993 [Homalodisca vitripennis]|nr:hypothetical protein J6590_045993 [Homalodisca vitripennis]